MRKTKFTLTRNIIICLTTIYTPVILLKLQLQQT